MSRGRSCAVVYYSLTCVSKDSHNKRILYVAVALPRDSERFTDRLSPTVSRPSCGRYNGTFSLGQCRRPKNSLPSRAPPQNRSPAPVSGTRIATRGSRKQTETCDKLSDAKTVGLYSKTEGDGCDVARSLYLAAATDQRHNGAFNSALAQAWLVVRSWSRSVDRSRP
jgi:hypothetical protein